MISTIIVVFFDLVRLIANLQVSENFRAVVSVDFVGLQVSGYNDIRVASCGPSLSSWTQNFHQLSFQILAS